MRNHLSDETDAKEFLLHIWRVNLAVVLATEQHPCNLYLQKKISRSRDSFRKKTAFRVDVNVSINPSLQVRAWLWRGSGLSPFPFFMPHYSETLGRSIIIALCTVLSSLPIITPCLSAPFRSTYTALFYYDILWKNKNKSVKFTFFKSNNFFFVL